MLNKRSELFRSLFVLFIFLALCWAFQYGDILGLRPRIFHVFRQADCLSLTDNYYHGNWNFFQPSLHILFSDNQTTGKSAGEFPLLYYFVAILWKIFGKHEYIFRLVTIGFSLAGMYALYKLVYAILKDYFWALASAVLLFCSPIYAYYTNNFLVNVPAFSLMLIALYYFYLFWQSGKNKHFYICMALFLLAGLFKISSLLSFVVIGVIYLAEVSKLVRFKKEGLVFSQPRKQLFPFLIVLVGVSSWYLYANYYSNLHGGKYTYNGTASYWSETKAERKGAYDSVKEFMLYQIYSVATFVYLIACLIILAINFHKISMIWRITIPLLLLGYTTFIMLFFYSLNGHDYYHIDFLLIPVIINLAFLHYLSVNEIWALKSVSLKVFFSFFILYNVLYCSNNMHMRYWQTADDEKLYRQVFAPKTDLDLWNWYAWSYPNGSLEQVTPTLRAMGIKRDDVFLCPNDESFSIHLYLMDQKGFTNMQGALVDSAAISTRIRNGAKYMEVSDTTTLNEPRLRPYIHHEIKRFGNLRIYDLSPYKVDIKS